VSSARKEKLLEERSTLLKELGTLSHLLRGSWVQRYSVCSRVGCKCHNGERHGPRHYLVINTGRHQRQRYVANSQVKLALEGLAQYRRLQEIIGRITQLNLSLMKEENEDAR
jgi:hypothetical protein